jgi:hypothetical protein
VCTTIKWAMVGSQNFGMTDGVVWRKNKSIVEALQNNQSLKGLQRIGSTEEINQFVTLWTMVWQIQLTDQEDDISWHFSPNGAYTSSSAYGIQFVGTFADFNWTGVWKAKVENKCKFFCWLVL